MTGSLFATQKNAANPLIGAVDSVLELGAYETLWNQPSASFKTISEKFQSLVDALPSSFVAEDEAREAGTRIVGKLRESLRAWFNVRLRTDMDYPQRLRDANHPVELLYYQGDWDLIFTRSVAVVGTRNPSDEGIARAKNLASKLVGDGFTIASGLASGIDTAAHEAAIAAGGKTFAVLGTPLTHSYPKTNSELQKRLADQHLVVSQVPIERYEAQNPRTNKFFFPERNKTMSALSEATIIVEAGETSGTRTQARAALNQGRKLFILNNCFENGISWPQKFVDEGAVRVRDYADIRNELLS